jgi:hypothetical protein
MLAAPSVSGAVLVIEAPYYGKLPMTTQLLGAAALWAALGLVGAIVLRLL